MDIDTTRLALTTEGVEQVRWDGAGEQLDSQLTVPSREEQHTPKPYRSIQDVGGNSSGGERTIERDSNIDRDTHTEAAHTPSGPMVSQQVSQDMSIAPGSGNEPVQDGISDLEGNDAVQGDVPAVVKI